RARARSPDPADASRRRTAGVVAGRRARRVRRLRADPDDRPPRRAWIAPPRARADAGKHDAVRVVARQPPASVRRDDLDVPGAVVSGATSTFPADYQILVVGVDGRGRRQVTHENPWASFTELRFAADGRRLLYAGEQTANDRELYTIERAAASGS